MTNIMSSHFEKCLLVFFQSLNFNLFGEAKNGFVMGVMLLLLLLNMISTRLNE